MSEWVNEGVTGGFLSHLWFWLKVSADSEECNVRGYKPLSEIQTSAHTGPVDHRRTNWWHHSLEQAWAHYNSFCCLCLPPIKPGFIQPFRWFSKQRKSLLFFYLAVSSCDHVDVVTDQFEGEASIHQGEAALWRKRTEWLRDVHWCSLTSTDITLVDVDLSWFRYWLCGPRSNLKLFPTFTKAATARLALRDSSGSSLFFQKMCSETVSTRTSILFW